MLDFSFLACEVQIWEKNSGFLKYSETTCFIAREYLMRGIKTYFVRIFSRFQFFCFFTEMNNFTLVQKTNVACLLNEIDHNPKINPSII